MLRYLFNREEEWHKILKPSDIKRRKSLGCFCLVLIIFNISFRVLFALLFIFEWRIDEFTLILGTFMTWMTGFFISIMSLKLLFGGFERWKRRRPLILRALWISVIIYIICICVTNSTECYGDCLTNIIFSFLEVFDFVIQFFIILSIAYLYPSNPKQLMGNLDAANLTI